MAGFNAEREKTTKVSGLFKKKNSNISEQQCQQNINEIEREGQQEQKIEHKPIVEEVYNREILSHYDSDVLRIIHDNQMESIFIELSNSNVATEPYTSDIIEKDDSNLDAMIATIMSDLEDEGVVGNLPRDLVQSNNSNYNTVRRRPSSNMTRPRKVPPLYDNYIEDNLNSSNTVANNNTQKSHKEAIDLEVI